ncbi:nickel-dependent lactate racemase [Paenibacillus alkaliterrae]|uniref:lactate racemase domain-containing protein n=1 Tax=Paenibacillus alkaliterrae TaxID=320909 RepID=UPI001F1CF68B|nr:lactate racemase domain-containing protein [Paenibacillus alkaliterrae]MCF2938051.1 nickel-dependent lactate racemase [Paenibacillus alkaliterrae]
MSDILTKLVENTPIPKLVKIRQSFDDTILEDPIGQLIKRLRAADSMSGIAAGHKVAVAVGSRGISRIDELTKTVIDELKRIGAEPFIVPCMGSHGGATAEGQTEVLAHLGIDEERMGCPVRSSMEVIELDRLPNGLPIYCDKIAAMEADDIIVINRIKPHTAFRGAIESGMFKMISIGLGKQKGAEACHQLGFKYMAENVPAMARVMIEKLPIRFGVAIVENAYDQICRIEVLGTDIMEEREKELLVEAKSRLPQILFADLDVLVIDYIGKNISGDGADPNITGRYPTPYAHGGPEVNKMVVLDLTPESKGNANGVGTADFTTSRLVSKTDWPSTYANGLTSTVCAPTKQATTLANDRDAIKAAIKTCNILDYTQCKLIRIRDTLHLGTIEISESLLEEAKSNPRIEILEGPYEWQFDEEGYLPK